MEGVFDCTEVLWEHNGHGFHPKFEGKLTVLAAAAKPGNDARCAFKVSIQFREGEAHQQVNCMAKDLGPYSIIENKGFRAMMHRLESKYKIPPQCFLPRQLSKHYTTQTKLKSGSH